MRKSHVWRMRNESAEEHRDRAQMTRSSNITAVTLAKDIRLEWRSKDAINAMLFFSLLVVVIFSFHLILPRRNRVRLPAAWFG